MNRKIYNTFYRSDSLRFLLHVCLIVFNNIVRFLYRLVA